MTAITTRFWIYIVAAMFFVIGFIFGIGALREVKKNRLNYIYEGFASSYFGAMALLCIAIGLAIIIRLNFGKGF